MINFSLFESHPGNSLALLSDAPRFTVVAVTKEFLQKFTIRKEQIIGKGLFEVQSENFDPGTVLKALIGVTEHNQTIEVILENYLGFNHEKLNDRGWRITNIPVQGSNNKVEYIIHNVEEVYQNIQSKDLDGSKNLFLAAPIVIGVVKGDEYIIDLANDELLQVWNRKSDVVGKPLLTAIPELQGQGFIELLDQVRETGTSYHATEAPINIIRNGKDELIFMNFIYKAFYENEPNGKASGVIAIGYDVTEQVLARRRIEESEALLQQKVKERTEDLNNQKLLISTILDVSLEGIYAIKSVRNSGGKIIDFEYLFANKHIVNLLGLKAEQVIGSSILKLLPENRSNGFFDLFCKLLDTRQEVHDETHFVTQGIDSWFNYSIVPIDSETLVVSTRDISEQKKSLKAIEEQRNLLNSIMENSSNGISVSKVFRDKEGRVIDALTIIANDSAVKYIGLPREIYLTKKATEIEPAIIDSPYYQACIKTLDTGEPFVMQYFMQSTERWLELTVSKLDNDHLIHIFTDITPIKEAQLQLEKYVEDLQRSNQNLEQFAYAASHDLKEPMRKILLFSERLRLNLEGKLEPDHQHYFSRIQHAAHRMNTLIDDLLLYSSVSMGAVLNESVDLNEVVQTSLEDLEVEIEENNVSIAVGPLPALKGHRRQLQQVFQNLIGNAIKYRKPDVPGKIEITSCMVHGNDDLFPLNHMEQNQMYFLIEVSDNGIGFNPADAQRIFDVFTRLHGNAEFKGTGVGLSIVRKIVESHNGHVWAEGTLGKGAKFKILFPDR